MPKYTQEKEEKIIELIEKDYKNAQIARELGVYRGAVAKRRKEYLKQRPDHKKPETEHEETIQQEQKGSHPLDSQIYTLIRYQGTHSREEALSQAIETQHSFNPYILNHGLKTPKELIKFFEEEIQLDRALAKDLMVDNNISQRLIATHQETIAELKELVEQRYEEGKNDFALLVYCTSCGQPITLTPGTETHRHIVEFCRKIGIIHSDCIPKYKRIYA
jgi:transposase-like protein